MQPVSKAKPTLLIKWVIIGCLVLFQAIAAAADLAREQRIDEQISDAILDGEAVYLQAGEQRFLGIYTKAGHQPARGAALILHGRGANPDWIDIINPLRTRLPEYGWDTLSVQLPVASEGASDAEWAAVVPESLPRVGAALDFLKKQGTHKIVLISHSFGTHTAAGYLSSKRPAAVVAWVGIGMSPDQRTPETDTMAMLPRIKLPILDLYGQQDLANVISTAEARRKAAHGAGNDAYEQREIAGADHFFSRQDDLLVSMVKAWLAKVSNEQTDR
jgi:pimeloyl-ACP methyl ester carboxylesterase